MTPPRLPQLVASRLANPQMRQHHLLWHATRMQLTAEQRASLPQEWRRPPRLNGHPGSGIDFLGMHRFMIQQVNDWLAEANDQSYQRVEGWPEIPWLHDDEDWPMPPAYVTDDARLNETVIWAKDPAVTRDWRTASQEQFRNTTWLRGNSLDQVGQEIENGIHNWMHMHWSAAPWYTGAPGQDFNDLRNDYLGSPDSSHVHPVFWKLHGWIDDTIGLWERAGNRVANLAGAWAGPPDGGHDHGMMPMDTITRTPELSPELLKVARQAFLHGIRPN